MAHDVTRHQLDNPLFHYYDQIDTAARVFAEEIDADPALSIKAARIACDPPTWECVDGLTDAEKVAFREERTRGFFRQPKMLKVAIITLCFSAMVQGWIQSVINGANQTLPEYFGWKHDDPDNHQWVNNGSAIWRFAAVNAITYLAAGVCGCWFSDPLQSSILGRRGAIFGSACLCIMASIGAASVRRPYWWHLLIWRGILGLSLGAKAAVTPIFGAEISPNHLRGTLVMNWQLMDALGIFFGFSANLIFYWTDELAWRFQIASACIPAVLLLSLIWVIPESPRYLLKKGRGKQAFAALCALRETPLQAATELFFANAQIQREIHYMHKEGNDADPEKAAPDEEVNGNAKTPNERGPSLTVPVQELGQLKTYRDAVKRTNYWTRIIQLFFDGRTRRSAVAASVVMFGQQLCGVNVLAFYSTVFIQDINGQSTRNIRALWLSWGLGLANFIFTFPAYWWIDKYGRRFLLLVTYPGMILSLLGACLSFVGGGGDDANSSRIVRVCVFIFIFIFFYSLGQGPVAFAYASEVFPLWNREAGMSLAVFVNLTGAGLLTLFVPRAQVSSHTYTPSSSSSSSSTPSSANDPAWLSRQATLVGVFAGLCTLSFTLIYFLVPETKLATTREDNKRTLNYISLEELNQIFQVRTHECVRYYVRHVAWGRVNNLLVWLRVRGRERWVRIDDSMHFWVHDGLERGKGRAAAAAAAAAAREAEAEAGGADEHGGGAGADRVEAEQEKEKSKDEGGMATAQHVEDRSEESSAVSRGDAVSGVPEISSVLPHVADTGGRLDFEAEREKGES